VTRPDAPGADALVHAEDLQDVRPALVGRRECDAAHRARADGLGSATRAARCQKTNEEGTVH